MPFQPPLSLGRGLWVWRGGGRACALGCSPPHPTVPPLRSADTGPPATGAVMQGCSRNSGIPGDRGRVGGEDWCLPGLPGSQSGSREERLCPRRTSRSSEMVRRSAWGLPEGRCLLITTSSFGVFLLRPKCIFLRRKCLLGYLKMSKTLVLLSPNKAGDRSVRDLLSAGVIL